MANPNVCTPHNVLILSDIAAFNEDKNALSLRFHSFDIHQTDVRLDEPPKVLISLPVMVNTPNNGMYENRRHACGANAVALQALARALTAKGYDARFELSDGSDNTPNNFVTVDKLSSKESSGFQKLQAFDTLLKDIKTTVPDIKKALFTGTEHGASSQQAGAFSRSLTERIEAIERARYQSI